MMHMTLASHDGQFYPTGIQVLYSNHGTGSVERLGTDIGKFYLMS